MPDGSVESGEPAHVATAEGELSAELKRGLAFVRTEKHRPDTETPKTEGRECRLQQQCALLTLL